AHDLASDLRRFLEGQPVQANSRRRSGGRRKRMRAFAAAIAATAAIGLIVGFGVWLTLSLRQPARTVAAASDNTFVATSNNSSAAQQAKQPLQTAASDTKVAVHRIAPAAMAKSEGGVLNGAPIPFNLPAQSLIGVRYQQIYSHSDFDSPGTITAIRFRRDEGEPPFDDAG